MDAIIRLDVPDWQIGQEVKIYFPDTMCKTGVCEALRPKGKWIWEEEWLPSNTAHPAECQYAGWVCNQCHEFPTDDDKWEEIDEKPQFEYCPKCGADMRGENT